MNNIRTHKCNKCPVDIKINMCDKKKDMFYFFCSGCLKNINVCSKKNCQKLFLLNNNDIVNLKVIYMLNSNSKFYLYDDVMNVINIKYGSLENLKQIIKEKKRIKKEKMKKLEDEKIKRENKLKDLFMLYKLEYKNYGDCYSYIHYATPDLNIVLKNELNNLKIKSMRQFVLANELQNIRVPLDESIKPCYEYINNINTKPLDDIVKSIKMEYDIKNNTYDNMYDLKEYNICV